MRQRRFAALVLVLLLALTACGGEKGKQEGLQLYFPVSRAVSYGSALSGQRWEGEEDPTPRELMEALLAGPSEEGLITPFPKGVTLQKLEQEGAVVRLTLSEQYGGLTDIAQTLADASIVLTLCQLDGVEEVVVSTAGFWATRPPSRTLRPGEMELDSLLP